MVSSEPQDPSSTAPGPSPADNAPDALAPPKWHGTTPFFHYSAIGFAIIAPLALLAPSGRRGRMGRAQNMVLYSATFLSLNQLAFDYTGKSIMQRSNERWAAVFESFASATSTLPEKARQNKVLMEAERTRRETSLPAEERARAEEARRLRERMKEQAEKGFLGELWMGDEDKDWKKKRMEQERKALESGKGYSTIIMDQIREVWYGKTEKDGTDDGEVADKNANGNEKPRSA